LKGWDDAADGWYFVTFCTQGRECFFGKIVDRRMRLSKVGNIALRYWEDIPNHSANASLDAFVIMPNHLHGILTIKRTTTDIRRREFGDDRRIGQVDCSTKTRIAGRDRAVV
jgi:putative transposase